MKLLQWLGIVKKEEPLDICGGYTVDQYLERVKEAEVEYLEIKKIKDNAEYMKAVTDLKRWCPQIVERKAFDHETEVYERVLAMFESLKKQ